MICINTDISGIVLYSVTRTAASVDRSWSWNVVTLYIFNMVTLDSKLEMLHLEQLFISFSDWAEQSVLTWRQEFCSLILSTCKCDWVPRRKLYPFLAFFRKAAIECLHIANRMYNYKQGNQIWFTCMANFSAIKSGMPQRDPVCVQIHLAFVITPEHVFKLWWHLSFVSKTAVIIRFVIKREFSIMPLKSLSTFFTSVSPHLFDFIQMMFGMKCCSLELSLIL